MNHTITWTQSDAADFEKGVLRNLSLRSDGLLTLAPRSRELLDQARALFIRHGSDPVTAGRQALADYWAALDRIRGTGPQ